MEKLRLIGMFCLAMIINSSCKKFLDAKPDAKLAVPSTIEELQAILDNYSIMNRAAPLINNMTDEYYLRATDWEAEYQLNKESYVWDPQANYYTEDNDWSKLYNSIYYANTVLDNLKNASGQQAKLDEIKGAALFFRGVYYYQLAHLYTPPYAGVSGENNLGVVLRLSADFNQPIGRSSVQKTYEQMIKDFEEAATHLPAQPAFKTRPSKAAAYGYLAKCYLDMQNYEKVREFTSAALNLYDTIVDYNEVVPAFNPFKRFFPETIFYQSTQGALNGYDWVSMVDTTLFKTYEENDLRKLLFFQDAQGNGTIAFEGTYSGVAYETFNGLATDELYLMRAEANARLDNLTGALEDVNFLLSKRYVTGRFIPRIANSKEAALEIILLERRKELLNRGVRWPDLRRLNQENQFATTLKRVLDAQIFELPPRDPRYTLLIPAKIIQLSALNQNPR